MRVAGRQRALLAVLGLVAAAGCGARVGPQEVSTANRLPPSAQAIAGASEASGPAVTSDTTATPAESRTQAPGAAPSAPGAVPATPGVTLSASDVGITPDTIKLGHVTQLTGPVPGLFAGSVVGIQAFVAYQNSIGGIQGRKLQAVIRDDQFDAAANRTATRDLIANTFALVGGISLYDDASAADVKAAGIPDVTTAISATRAEIPNNFAPSPNVDGAPTGPWLYLKETFPDVVPAMASLYGDVPAAKRVHVNYRAAAESLGFKWVYDRGYQPTETDYTADIIRMRQSGAKALFLMSVDAKNVARILKAAQQQGWRPDVIFLGASSYDSAMTTLAGSAADGVQVFLPYSLFAGEDAGIVPEVRLFDQWVQKVKPGAVPDGYAAGAWMAGRLFAQAMAKAGPNPTRKDAVDALRRIDSFDANGMMGPSGPASKRPVTCFLVAELKGGKFHRLQPQTGYRCGGGYFHPS